MKMIKKNNQTIARLRIRPLIIKQPIEYLEIMITECYNELARREKKFDKSKN